MNLLMIIVGISMLYLEYLHCCDSIMKPVIQQEDIAIANYSIMKAFTYVDKTKFILQLLNDSKKRYFFSRPRRFGKTIFLRTVQAIFDHHRNGEEIFNGTYISKPENNYGWQKYPVLYFDLSLTLHVVFEKVLLDFRDLEGMKNISDGCVYLPEYADDMPPIPLQHFYEVVCSTYNFGKGRRIVILIDEYDQPILRNLKTTKNLNYSLNFLRQLFLMMKQLAGEIALAVVTGVTRSSFLDVGSGSGDFYDFSSDKAYGAIAGVTKEELTTYFQFGIEKIARKRKVTKECIEKEVNDWYDGYSFTDAMEKVYNPQSLMKYFKRERPGVYWVIEGRPSFFWREFFRRPSAFDNLVEGQYSRLQYVGITDNAPAQVLMFECGYFTICGVDPEDISYYKLCYPNKEVRSAFIIEFASVSEEESRKIGGRDLYPLIGKMKKAILTPIPNFNHFMAVADSAIQSWPFRHKFEKGYNLHMAALMYMAGLKVEPQKNANSAIIDIYAYNTETIFLFELKFNRSGFTEAWKHVERSIATFYFRDKNILAAGISFTSKNTNTVLGGWRAELYTPNGTLIRKYNHEESYWYEQVYLSAKTKAKNMGRRQTAITPNDEIQK